MAERWHIAIVLRRWWRPEPPHEEDGKLARTAPTDEGRASGILDDPRSRSDTAGGMCARGTLDRAGRSCDAANLDVGSRGLQATVKRSLKNISLALVPDAG